MLTRHLYVDTEVHAALAYAIVRGRSTEAAFWCDELLDTGLEKEAWATLLDTWLWHALATCPEWASMYYRSTPIVDAAHALCRAPKDNSLRWVLVSCLEEGPQPDRITYRGWVGVESGDECFRLAILQKKARLAWWLLVNGHVGALKIHPLLLESSKTIAQCATVLLMCCDISTAKKLEAFPYTDERQKWTAQKGRYKSRRRYPIPIECLYGRPGRGMLQTTESTLPSLWNIEATLKAERGTFWSALLPTTNDEEGWTAFYDTYFPDDLPEECLTAAQERYSHGPGLLRSSELSLPRMSRIWFNSESRFAWGLYEWPASLPLTGDFDSVLALQHTARGPLRATPVRPVVRDGPSA